MSFTTKCPHCGARQRLPDDLAGRRARRKDCGKGFEAPEDDEGEPWYYGFLTLTAVLILVVGLLMFVGGWVFLFKILKESQEAGGNVNKFTFAVLLCGTLGTLVATLFSAAALLLALDVGRSLREIKPNTGRRSG